MSDSFKDFVESKENTKQDIVANQKEWELSVGELYVVIKGWLADFPTVKVYEEYSRGGSRSPGGHSKTLNIVIGGILIALQPDAQKYLGCIGAIDMVSQKGRKRLHLKIPNDWKFYEKIPKENQPIKKGIQNLSSSTSTKSVKYTDLNEETFKEALMELAK